MIGESAVSCNTNTSTDVQCQSLEDKTRTRCCGLSLKVFAVFPVTTPCIYTPFMDTGIFSFTSLNALSRAPCVSFTFTSLNTLAVAHDDLSLPSSPSSSRLASPPEGLCDDCNRSSSSLAHRRVLLLFSRCERGVHQQLSRAS